MRHTNRLNLPEQFVRLAESDPHTYKDNYYSVTELLKPVREIVLERVHRDEIVRDIADEIPAILGTAVHAIFQSAADPKDWPEVALEARFGDCAVTGRADLLSGEEIVDYKTTSSGKVMKGDFAEWERQVKCYAYLLFRSKGLIARKGTVYAIIKDWSKVKAASNPNYPQSAVVVHGFPIADSDYDETQSWIETRLAEIKAAYETLPECTDEEKWYTGTKYAVFKNPGDKRAAAVLDSEDEAHTYITERLGGVGQIDVRKGQCLKCDHYCDCRAICKGREATE